jgi:hypothetical protein
VHVGIIRQAVAAVIACETLLEVVRMERPIRHENVVLPKRIRPDRRIADAVLVREVEAVQEQVAFGVFEFLELTQAMLIAVPPHVALIRLARMPIAITARRAENRTVQNDEAAFA